MKQQIQIGDVDVTLHEDGSIEIPDYDPEEQLVLIEMGYEAGVAYWLMQSWNLVLEALKEEGVLDDFVEALQGKRTKYSYYVGTESWPFDMDDVRNALVVALKHYMDKEYTEDAVAVARIIKEMDWSIQDMPEITVESHISHDQHGEPRAVRFETHKLTIADEEIAEWEHAVERSVTDYVFFETTDDDLMDLREGGGEYGPEAVEGLEEVLEALGLEDEEPEGPDEDDMYLPSPDTVEEGDGEFGIMYERALNYDAQGRRLPEPEIEVEIAVYDREQDAWEWADTARRMIRNWGDDIEVTVVRRRSPSEEAQDIEDAKVRAAMRRQYKLFNGGTTQEIEEPDPVYLEWRPLEEKWQDRPEDFEG